MSGVRVESLVAVAVAAVAAAIEAGGNGGVVFTGGSSAPPTCGGPDRLLLGKEPIAASPSPPPTPSPSPSPSPAVLVPLMPEGAAVLGLFRESDDDLARVVAVGARDRQDSALAQSLVEVPAVA